MPSAGIVSLSSQAWGRGPRLAFDVLAIIKKIERISQGASPDHEAGHEVIPSQAMRPPRDVASCHCSKPSASPRVAITEEPKKFLPECFFPRPLVPGPAAMEGRLERLELELAEPRSQITIIRIGPLRIEVGGGECKEGPP